MGLINSPMLNAPARATMVADRVPVGSVFAFLGTNIPNQYLPCAGQSLLRTAYPELFAVLGTAYGAADDVHFNLPNLTDGQFLEGGNAAGTAHNAGLPNIYGEVSRGNVGLIGAEESLRFTSGAFSPGEQTYTYVVANSPAGYTGVTLTFDASRNSSVYGNSSTVQPKSLTVVYIIKAVDGGADAMILNHREVFRESGTFTAPVTGWYRFIIKGGGGGGSGAYESGGVHQGGGGGGEGGTAVEYEQLMTGNTAAITIGAGGAGGAKHYPGTNGGNSVVIINNHTYIGYGGTGGGTEWNGSQAPAPAGGAGGAGTIHGAPGGTGQEITANGYGYYGGNGGGNGGACPPAPHHTDLSNFTGVDGGGGAGGAGGSGSDGGDGFVVIEYFDPSLR